MAPNKKLEKAERASVKFQLDQESDFEAGKFRGIASVFGSVVDTFPNRTRFRRGAFAKTIADRASRIKILLMHDDRGLWIGLPTMLAESADGLLVEASLNTTNSGQDVSAALKHASQLGKLDAVELSIGFDVLNFEMVEDEETEEVFREITEARLWEISVVNFGADRQTKIMEAAAMDTPVDSEWLTQTIDSLMLGMERQGDAVREQFVGKKISKKNVARLRDAVKVLQELLAIAEPPETDEESLALTAEVEEMELELAEAEMGLTTNGN
jgi:HK97 family phage prohead protease